MSKIVRSHESKLTLSLTDLREQQTMNAIHEYLVTKQRIREKMQQQGKVSVIPS